MATCAWCQKKIAGMDGSHGMCHLCNIEQMVLLKQQTQKRVRRYKSENKAIPLHLIKLGYR